jgi:hypothetical protein
MQVTNGRNRSNASIRYNCLTALRFPTVTLAASQASTVVQGRIPLAVNFKIMAVAATLYGSVAGTELAINIVSGPGAYSDTGIAPWGYATLTGTYAAGDTFTIILAGVSYTYTVNANNAGNNAAIAQQAAAAINLAQPFASQVLATAQGTAIVIALIAYNTTTPTLAVSKNSTSGNIAVSGANLANGAAGTLPAQPVIDNPLQTAPFNIAAAGTSLFPIDLPIYLGADQPSVFYPSINNNFDAIWPSFSELTLRTITGSDVTGSLEVTLWGVPYDVNPFMPQAATQAFTPGPQTI